MFKCPWNIDIDCSILFKAHHKKCMYKAYRNKFKFKYISKSINVTELNLLIKRLSGKKNTIYKLIHKNMEILKVKRLKNAYQINTKIYQHIFNKVVMAILILDKRYFRIKYYWGWRGSLDDNKIYYVHVTNKIASRFIKQKWMELQGRNSNLLL